MSEFQYYEFVAIDSPLSLSTQKKLRAITSRATITATRLVNSYEWGDFKGDPHARVARRARGQARVVGGPTRGPRPRVEQAAGASHVDCFLTRVSLGHDVEVHHVLAAAQLRVQRDCRLVTIVRLDVGHPRAAQHRQFAERLGKL